MPDYDANQFEEYKNFMDFLDQNPWVKWKEKFRSFVSEIGQGIKALESTI